MTGNMIGRIFNNRYQITDRIGIGGMAEVYRAQDTVLGRLVAVKIMLPQYAADADFTQRFRQEAAAAANLQSPYIVNVYDWGQDNGTYYIVMEYVRGSDLKTAIQQRGPVNQRKVAEIGAQVCQALSVAHNQDIIHRDIKPQNIMVQPDGNVKVMDFGIARAKNSVKEQTSSVLGTAHYISPEQAQGKELTSASDIYSLGIVMYEAATGELPFDGPDSVSVAMKQVNDLPVPPSQINPAIDPALEDIIMKALEKDPYARFATVSDMKHCLNDYLNGRPVDVGGETAIATPLYTPESTSVMPPIGGEPAGGMGAVKTYSAEDEDALAEKKRKRNIIIAVAAVVAVCAVAAIAFFALSGGSTRVDQVAVPDVAGKSVAEATATLTGSGFTVGSTNEVYSDTVESGKVVSTTPASGAKAAKGSAVTLTVSKGADKIEVPNLSGMGADEARNALADAGLKANEGTSAYSDTVSSGQVMSQDPSAGTTVGRDTTVTFVISKGSEGLSVPNVAGNTESSATTTLKNAGFSVDTYYDYSDTVAQGTVISQDPASGTSLKKGETVSITVSMGKKEKKQFTITASAGAGGTISPNGTATVTEGDTPYYTITANTGYIVSEVLIDGQKSSYLSPGSTSFSYQFQTVEDNHTISATFTASPAP